MRANKIWRLEAEYYSQNAKLGIPSVSGEALIDFVQYGTSKELNELGGGFPVLRLNEFDSLFIKKPAKYCDKIDTATYYSLSLKKNDVLICRTNGNPKLVGKCALVPKDYDYAFASYLFRIRPKRDIINSATLAVYLNGQAGRLQIEKNLMISNQTNFSPTKFREIQIPRFGSLFQTLVERAVYIAYQKMCLAHKFYSEAEELLLEKLGLKNWQPKHQLTFVKKFSEVVKAGRIDADYFQLKYEKIIKVVKKFGKYDLAKNIISIKDDNFIPNKDSPYKYMELSNISTNGDITGYTEEQGSKLPTRARRKASTGDLIVSSIEGSLDSIALITMNTDNVLCSTGFYVIQSPVLNSESLLVLLKSPIGQLQLKKGCSGTILTALSKEELEHIILPIIDSKLQNKVKSKITKMYSSKAKEKALLQIAKEGVDRAVANAEKNATEFLRSEVRKLGIEI